MDDGRIIKTETRPKAERVRSESVELIA
jgi:hypothetical protein